MKTPPTAEFENLNELRSLREAAPAALGIVNGFDIETRFYAAAHAALGPEGCVTGELERLTRERGTNEFCERRAVEEIVKLRRELDRVLDEENLSDYGSDFSQWMADLKKARAERDELKMMLHEGTQLKLAKALAETRNEIIRKLTTERDVLKDEVKRLQSEIEDLRCALKDE